MKNKLLRVKFILIFLVFLIIAAPVSANEIIRLNQFNNYLKQAQDLNASEKPQEAQEALQQAKEKIHTTLLVKSLKNEEIKQTEKEIEEVRQLMDEEVKGTITENLPTPTPFPSIMPKNSDNSSVVLTPTPQPAVSSPTTMPTELDKEKVCRQANDLLLEIKQACDIKPFPGIEECIEEIESTLEYLGEEDYKKYHMDDKVNNLKDLRSRYLPLKNQCEE